MPNGYSLAASYYRLNASGESSLDSNVIEATKPSEIVVKQIDDVPGVSVQVPRLPLSKLNWKNRARFLEMMERHSFVVLTDLGEKLEGTHDQVLQEFEAFFTSDDEDWKNGCTSKHVYLNEHGKPFWYAGYEHTSVRDCFRVACGDMSRLVWPSPEFKKHWLSLQRRMQRICDRALSLTVGYDIEPSHSRTDKDFSVCYGLHYPNIEGSGQSETENVFEHVDPSLFVVEPVPNVEGLDVFDQHSKQWLKAEKVCVPGKEIVLFCGHALNRATEGRIPGTLHRVRRTPDRRFCIIYEQKYEEYFL
ncbi:Serine/threonine protein phosphatase [Phytophthora nicotianae]|nr:Serine/threonine protein phosphatase [Phytophthora nicotianae]